MKKIYIAILFITQFLAAQTLTIDSTFSTGTGFDLWSGFGSITVDKVLLQPDNKIIVVGQYINYNGTTSNCITRLNANGSKDTTFSSGTGPNAGIWGCFLQPDGKIIIYGGFTSYNGAVASRITRLNANGTKDTTFSVGTGPDNYIESAKLQSDGKIIIIGSFLNFNGVARARVARINANGTLDTSFNVGSGANDRVREVVIQSDGKAIIGGDFTAYNDIAKGRMVRLNTDGSIDTSYNIGTGALYRIWTMELQSDNKLLIGGEFQAYNGVARNRIARINTDGTLDTTFTIGTGADSTVMSLYVQADNKIYIGGSFSNFNNVSRIGLARLNSDGSHDTSMTIGNGFNNWVTTITRQTDNKLLIGGNFTTYNSIAKNRIVRLIDSALGTESFGFEDFGIYPNPTATKLYINNIDQIDRYTIAGMDGKLIQNGILSGDCLNVESLQQGIYIMTLFHGNSKTIKRFIKE